jgi:hypothetical protein
MILMRRDMLNQKRDSGMKVANENSGLSFVLNILPIIPSFERSRASSGGSECTPFLPN